MPVSVTEIEAAMTLLRAIQAKLVTKSRTASPWAPEMPIAARAATIDGTRSREPIGASTATKAAPATAPTAITHSAAVRPREAGRLAPTWSVVATMLAPTKMRKRSKGLWV